MTEESPDVDDVSMDEVTFETIQDGFDADKITTRRKAAERSKPYVDENPSEGTAVVELLLDQLDDDALIVSQRSAEALSEIANDDPEVALDAAEPLIDAMVGETAMNQFYVAAAVRPIGAHDPLVFSDRIEEMFVILREEIGEPDEYDEARAVSDEYKESLDNMARSETQSKMAAHGIIANVIAAIAEADPDVLNPHVDELVSLVENDVEMVVVTILDSLASLAESDPAIVAGNVDDIVSLLDHHDEAVRAQAITVLGFVGEPDTADVVRGVAKTDNNEDVRALAEQTVAFLE